VRIYDFFRRRRQHVAREYRLKFARPDAEPEEPRMVPDRQSCATWPPVIEAEAEGAT